jgi:hypothetical protein
MYKINKQYLYILQKQIKKKKLWKEGMYASGIRFRKH